ncbi:hypothetical protein ACHQM5_029968 [Ranunculus cassubicifolius]
MKLCLSLTIIILFLTCTEFFQGTLVHGRALVSKTEDLTTVSAQLETLGTFEVKNSHDSGKLRVYMKQKVRRPRVRKSSGFRAPISSLSLYLGFVTLFSFIFL